MVTIGGPMRIPSVIRWAIVLMALPTLLFGLAGVA